MTGMEVALVAGAGLFSLFNGANDGGSLLATTLKMASLRPLTAALVLTATVVVAPVLFGTRVATTLADRLVSFRGERGQLTLLVAVVGATLVVVLLSKRGMPTSLTLALIGGIVGAGLGGGLPVTWIWVGFVLVLAALAPMVGLLTSFGVARLWAAMPLRARVGRQVWQAHRLSFVLQAFAYGANDGQKMLAVFAIAMPVALRGDHIATPVWMLLTVGVLFAAGTLLGVRRYSTRLGTAVLPVTPINAVTAQFSSAIAVMGSALVGAPVSMTQSMTGGLVGSGLTESAGRIRWQQAAGIAVAWMLTLPAAAVTAGLLAVVLVRS